MREDDAGTVHGRFRIPSFHGQALDKMLMALIAHPVRSHRHRHRREPPDRGAARAGVLPADRGHPRQVPAQGRRLRRHHRGHHDARAAAGRPRGGRGLHPGHRRPPHRRRGPTPRLCRRDHPRRPRRQVPAPRPRPPTPPAHRSPTPRHGHSATTAAPPQGCERPPAMCHAHHDTPWSQGGTHRPHHRPTALRPPPPPHPRPPLRPTNTYPTARSPSTDAPEETGTSDHACPNPI